MLKSISSAVLILFTAVTTLLFYQNCAQQFTPIADLSVPFSTTSSGSYRITLKNSNSYDEVVRSLPANARVMALESEEKFVILASPSQAKALSASLGANAEVEEILTIASEPTNSADFSRPAGISADELKTQQQAVAQSISAPSLQALTPRQKLMTTRGASLSAIDISLSEFAPPIGDQQQLNSCLSWVWNYFYRSYMINKAKDRPSKDSLGSVVTQNVCNPVYNYNISRNVLMKLDQVGCVPLSHFPWQPAAEASVSPDGKFYARMEDYFNRSNALSAAEFYKMPQRASDYIKSWELAYSGEQKQYYHTNQTPEQIVAFAKTKLQSAEPLAYSLRTNIVETYQPVSGLVTNVPGYVNNAVLYDYDTRLNRIDTHAITLVGFDDEREYINQKGERKKGAFLFANSWGRQWGFYNSAGENRAKTALQVQDKIWPKNYSNEEWTRLGIGDMPTRGYIWIAYDLMPTLASSFGYVENFKPLENKKISYIEANVNYSAGSNVLFDFNGGNGNTASTEQAINNFNGSIAIPLNFKNPSVPTWPFQIAFKNMQVGLGKFYVLPPGQEGPPLFDGDLNHPLERAGDLSALAVFFQGGVKVAVIEPVKESALLLCDSLSGKVADVMAGKTGFFSPLDYYLQEGRFNGVHSRSCVLGRYSYEGLSSLNGARSYESVKAAQNESQASIRVTNQQTGQVQETVFGNSGREITVIRLKNSNTYQLSYHGPLTGNKWTCQLATYAQERGTFQTRLMGCPAYGEYFEQRQAIPFRGEDIPSDLFDFSFMAPGSSVQRVRLVFEKEP